MIALSSDAFVCFIRNLSKRTIVQPNILSCWENAIMWMSEQRVLNPFDVQIFKIYIVFQNKICLPIGLMYLLFKTTFLIVLA